MRTWNFGQADAEFADMDAQTGSFRTPFGPWGDTASLGETDAADDAVLYTGLNGIGAVYETVIEIANAQIKAKLGQVPILILAQIEFTSDYASDTASGVIWTRRMLKTPDWGDWSNWRYDKSLDYDWYQDKQHIVRGQDVEDAVLHYSPWSSTYNVYDQINVAITDVVSRALRDNTNIVAHLSEEHAMGSRTTPRLSSLFESRRPNILFAYLYPIEFYRDDGSGDLDLAAPITDNPGDEYYIGAVEPGATGTPTKGHIRNFSDATQHVEIFDDHPEYTDPISRIGTGQLDFVALADNAVSQKYTAVFYSATQYEIKAEAYRDNAISLHPTINADASWRGNVSSTFTAPSGGLSIPATAWQSANIATSDEYEVGVRGNTTDTGWPADSNDQVEITKDNAGSADATAWRPILGHREKSTAQTTIDATTKFIPTRRIVPADWPVDTKAFIQDATNINEGAISSTQEASIGTDSFVGSGLDDLTLSGNFNGVWTNTLRIRIDGTGTPDTFEWSMDNGSTWEATDVPITGSAQLLQDGIYVTFAATTGHTLTEYWNAAIASWGIELKSLTANSNVYNSGAIVGTTLPIRSVAASTFSVTDQASGVSEATPARIFVESTVGFAAAQDIFIQNPNDPTTGEYREIDSVVTGQYIDVTVALTQDYPVGSFVAVLGSGEAAFWMRPVATAITTEELKRFRLNARLL